MLDVFVDAYLYILGVIAFAFLFGINEDKEASDEHLMYAIIAAMIWPLTGMAFCAISVYQFARWLRR